MIYDADPFPKSSNRQAKNLKLSGGQFRFGRFGCRRVHLSWQVFAMPMMPPIHQDQYWSIENCASSFKIHGFIIFICTFWKDRNGETIQVRRLNGLTMGWRSIITSHVDPFRSISMFTQCFFPRSPTPQPPNPGSKVSKAIWCDLRQDWNPHDASFRGWISRRGSRSVSRWNHAWDRSDRSWVRKILTGEMDATS